MRFQMTWRQTRQNGTPSVAHLAVVLGPEGAAVVVVRALEEPDGAGRHGLGRVSTWVQSGLLIVGMAVAAATAQRHLSVLRLVLIVTFGSEGSPAGWWSWPVSLPPA